MRTISGAGEAEEMVAGGRLSMRLQTTGWYYPDAANSH